MAGSVRVSGPSARPPAAAAAVAAAAVTAAAGAAAATAAVVVATAVAVVVAVVIVAAAVVVAVAAEAAVVWLGCMLVVELLKIENNQLHFQGKKSPCKISACYDAMILTVQTFYSYTSRPDLCQDLVVQNNHA